MKHVGDTVAERGGLVVINCRHCGFAHLDPLPSQAKLASFYRDEFWQVEKPGAAATIEGQLDWWSALWGMWLRATGRLVRGGSPPGSVIDLGAGHGHFVKCAADLGWKAIGVEPNTAARRYAERELGVEMVDLGVDDLPSGVVADVASVQWVLEHLLDPAGFLADLAFRVDALILAVPNEFTRAQQLAGSVASVQDWWVDKTHINYFTMKSLASLLRSTGWTPVDWFGTYPMEGFILDGRDYTDDPNLGPALHAGVRRSELSLGPNAMEVVYRSRGEAGVGRDLIVVCRSWTAPEDE